MPRFPPAEQPALLFIAQHAIHRLMGYSLPKYEEWRDADDRHWHDDLKHFDQEFRSNSGATRERKEELLNEMVSHWNAEWEVSYELCAPCTDLDG